MKEQFGSFQEQKSQCACSILSKGKNASKLDKKDSQGSDLMDFSGHGQGFIIYAKQGKTV